MWLAVMFDLPVKSKKQRYEATKFRNYLLDLGFEMSQFSVYFRFCASDARALYLIRELEKSLPGGGKVQMLRFTDKQYEKMITFSKSIKTKKKDKDQLALF